MKFSKFFFLLFLFFSCNKRNSIPEINHSISSPLKTKKDSTNDISISFSSASKLHAKINNKYSFLYEYPIIQIPLTDSTNFDNYEVKNFLSEKKIKLLKLREIIVKKQPNLLLNKAFINYRLNLSPNFNTLVISFMHDGETELFTYLLNYDLDFNIIDSLLIAYDEVVENWSRTTSYLTKNKITIKEIDYIESDPKIEIRKYSIKSNGEIKYK